MSLKKTLGVIVLFSFILMGSNCHGTMSVGVAYPGAWGYGPYGGPYGGPYTGVYAGTSFPVW